MPFGAPGNEKVILNVDSLWSGGPFGAAVRSSAPIAGSIIVADEYRTTPAAIPARRSTHTFLVSAIGSSRIPQGVRKTSFA